MVREEERDYRNAGRNLEQASNEESSREKVNEGVRDVRTSREDNSTESQTD